MPTAEDFLAAAREAAPVFGLDPIDVSLLSHSENVVFKIDRADGPVAMRLHRPGYNTLAQMNSEVTWVAALAEAGIAVPTPLAAPSGEFYVPITCGDEERFVGVVDWVEGKPLGGPLDSGDDGDSSGIVEHYRDIGVLAAQIRAQSVAWDRPPGFVRRAWDAEGFLGDEPAWGRFWDVEALTDEQRSLLSETRHALHAELSALPTDATAYGLIHADLHLGNVMTDGNSLTAIDFDDSGFGWFVYELAVALHPVLDEDWEQDCRAAIVDGYRQVHPLSEQEEALIDTFLTMRSVMLVGWLDARQELPAYEHFGDLAIEATTMAKRYLDGT